MKYSVLVEDNDTGEIHEYMVDVYNQKADKVCVTEEAEDKDEKLQPQTQNNNCTGSIDTDPQMCLNLSKAEYEHSFRRSEKLDNKVYILLTVCGFIFVLIVNAISNIPDIEVLKPCISRWIFAFDLLLIVTIGFTIFLLCLLIYCLSGIKLKRYDSNLTYEMNLTSLDKTTVARFAIFEYEIAKKYNNDKINKRFDWINISVYVLILDVVFLLALSVSGSFAKMATKDYREIVEENQEHSVDDIIDEINGDLELLREYYNSNSINGSNKVLFDTEGEEPEVEKPEVEQNNQVDKQSKENDDGSK